MDSIGDYLYILIFVGIIVVNILKNLKKQKPVADPGYSENYSEPKEDNEEEDFWRTPSPAPQEQTVQVQQIQHIRQIQNKRKDMETILQKNEPKEKSTGLLDEKEENKDSVSIAFNDKDDARRAFIYSEIWNRKYSS